MDMNSVLKAVMSSDALGQLSKATGIDEKAAASVLTDVMPLLINGAKSQSTNKDTATSFIEALASHGEKDSSDMAKFIKNVDVADGAKIVKHLLGSEKESKAQKISEKSGVDIKKVAMVMALAAPLVMNKLGKSAKKKAKENSKSDVADVVGAIVENVDVADVIKVAKLFL